MSKSRRNLVKTNAMRSLDRAGIRYVVHTYEIGEGQHLDAAQVAAQVGLPVGQVFKTLVLRGDRSGPLFAVLPGDRELQLKALARESGDRSVALVPLAQVTTLTGYVRGGTTVLASRRPLPVYVDASVHALTQVTVSAGQRGRQMTLAPEDYVRVTGAQVVPIT